ncbi:MAG: Clp protease N-terminal domain-containing protein [Solirubrobacteraceae bacterium]
MFERFTPEARAAITAAQAECRRLRHNYLGVEHILLGLLLEPQGSPAGILGSFGVTLDDVRARLLEIVGEGDEPSPVEGQVPFTPRAKKVLELSVREALSFGTRVGPEHVLLAIVRERESVAMRVLGEAGVSPGQIRIVVMDSSPANIPEAGLSGFERFTERARKAVVLAETEARERKFSHVGTESLLLGLLREQEGLAARALEALNVDLERARTGVLERVKPGEGHSPEAPIPFTPRAKKVLERALDVDLGLRNYVGTEGILLALVSVNEGQAITVLRSLGVDPDQIRDAVIELSDPGVRRLGPRSRARGAGRRMASASASEAPALESGFRVAPGGDVLRLLMSAAARALEGGRAEMTMRDLLRALARDEDVGLVFAALGVEEAAILEAFDHRTAGEEPPEATAQD